MNPSTVPAEEFNDELSDEALDRAATECLASGSIFLTRKGE